MLAKLEFDCNEPSEVIAFRKAFNGKNAHLVLFEILSMIDKLDSDKLSNETMVHFIDFRKEIVDMIGDYNLNYDDIYE